MNDTQLANIFKALSNENRLRLFEEIRTRGETAYRDGTIARVGGCLLQHVIDGLSVGAPTVSHHLKELVQAGLVETERDGKHVRCRVSQTALEALRRFAGAG
jgi:ArsR family transcriptional regulator